MATTVSPPSGTASVQPNPGPPSAAVARAFLAKLQESAKLHMAQQRPWHELYDRNTIAKPETYSEAINRIKKNSTYFRVNYSLVLLSTVVISMLMSPLSILWLIALVLLWGYVFMVRTDPIIILGKTLTDAEKFVALCTVTFLVAFGLTKVGYIVMSGLTIGLAAVCAHAIFRVPDDLFLDDQDAGGFLSWLSQPSTSQQLPASIGHV